MSDAATISALLREQAPTWVTLIGEVETADFACEARLALRDGNSSVYRLHVRPGDVDAVVHVEEVEPRRLPAHCPDRHLWGDGGFCLGLPGDYPARPTTPATAAVWWETLRGFLLLQDDVAYTRRWPAACAWPHSAPGVLMDAQLTAYAWSVGLSPEVLERWSRAAVAPRSGEAPRAPGRRSPCPCGSGKQIRHCHEPALTMFQAGKSARAALDRQFWDSQRGRACCGSLDVCPLRSGGRSEIDGIE